MRVRKAWSWVLVLGMAGSGCGSRGKEHAWFPEQAGGFERVSVLEKASTLPEVVYQAGPRKCESAEYTGGMRVTVCQMRDAGSAGEVMQGWSEGSGEVRFQRGSYLVVARPGSGVGTGEAAELASNLGRRLP